METIIPDNPAEDYKTNETPTKEMPEITFEGVTFGGSSPTKHGGSIGIVLGFCNEEERNNLMQNLIYGQLLVTMHADDGDGTDDMYVEPLSGSPSCGRLSMGDDDASGRLSFGGGESIRRKLVAFESRKGRLIVKRTGHKNDEQVNDHAKDDTDQQDDQQMGLADGISLSSLNGLSEASVERLKDMKITTVGDAARSILAGNDLAEIAKITPRQLQVIKDKADACGLSFE